MRPPAIKKMAVKSFSWMHPAIIKRFIKLHQQSIGFGYDSGLENEVKVFSNELSKLMIEKMVILDVGANLGDWARNLKSYFPDSEIHAFEPSKSTYAVLLSSTKNLENFSTYNFGFGDLEQSQLLFFEKEKSGMASLYKRDLSHKSIDFDGFEKVEIKRLDNWLTQSKVRANVLKIDVEGHELAVLKGLGDYLQEFKLIQFEFGGTDIDSRTFFQDFWNFFKNTNFRLYRLTPRGKIPVLTYQETDEVFIFTTYFAINQR
jgi:FkbM family methyltransferase